MKKITPFFLVLFIGQSLFAQNFSAAGGEFIFNEHKTPCLTKEQRASIITSLQESEANLKAQKKLVFDTKNSGDNVLYTWPVEKASGFSYNDVWAISNYVDHDPDFQEITDYNCGSRSYDLASGYDHQGVDVFTWPFGWRQMENDEALITAAADGQIIFKRDGEPDRNCDLSGDLQWNAVYIQHADGTVAWYGHMKTGSVTTKNVGDTVSQGEVLGTIGSSGFSSGPHLHFETWEDSSYTTLIDPYVGACNNWDAQSKWESQKGYRESKVNAVLTHSNPPVFNACPNTEITNESNEFEVSDTIYFALYMRDQILGTSINLKVIKPDNSILFDWNFDFDATYDASWWYWNFTDVYDQEGTWTWQATYAGETVSHTFTVGDALSIEENTLANFRVHPNPFKDYISLTSTSTITSVKLVDVLGKVVLETTDLNGIETVSTKMLSQGLYFMTVTDTSHQEKTLKLIKQ